MLEGFRRRHRFAPLALAAACWLAPATSQARTLEIALYPIADVWPAAVRFMRVDRDFPIHEKDEDAGYILFEYTDGPKPCKGSLELIHVVDPQGREATRIAISIPDLPHRYEQMLLDKFLTRLRDERGPPPPPPRKPEPVHPDAAAPNPTQPTPVP